MRIGSSVRGAIDMTVLAVALGERRTADPLTRAVAGDAAQAALSGRIRLDEAAEGTPDEVIAELFASLWERWFAEEPGKAGSLRPDRGGGRAAP